MHVPGEYNISIYRGDHHSWPVRLYDNVGTVEEPVLEPMDLTGFVFSAQIREDPDDEVVLAELDFLDDELAAGWVKPYLTDAKSADMPVGQFKWDVQSVFAGETKTWFRGTVIVKPDITRPVE